MIFFLRKNRNFKFLRGFSQSLRFSSNNFDFVGSWPEEEKSKFLQDFRLLTDFVSESEEKEILNEVDPYLKRQKYEFDHWDDAIHGFRETERKHWYPKNKEILSRVMKVAFEDDKILPHIHVLDLDAAGIIKPHVDSVRYCGSTIAGLSLASDAIMRLIRIDETQYKDNSEYRNMNLGDKGYFVDVLLKQRSLYICSFTARYNFTHEILGQDVKVFNKSIPVEKKRRVSVICRNEPKI